MQILSLINGYRHTVLVVIMSIKYYCNFGTTECCCRNRKSHNLSACHFKKGSSFSFILVGHFLCAAILWLPLIDKMNFEFPSKIFWHWTFFCETHFFLSFFLLFHITKQKKNPANNLRHFNGFIHAIIPKKCTAWFNIWQGKN